MIKEKEADAVIIGGGISGCAIAYNLAKYGAHVVLLEKGDIASEASGRTGAIIGTQRRNPVLLPPMLASLRLWEHLNEELKADTEFVQGGNLYLAETDEEVAELEESVKEASEAGLGNKLLTPQEVLKIVPTIGSPFKAGAFSPKDGHSDPLKTTNAFANAAREHGAKIYTRCHALDIGLQAGRVSSVMTTRGEIKTPVVVNAAGVWANHVCEMVGLHLPVKLIRLSGVESQPYPPLYRAFVRAPYSGSRQRVNGGICIWTGWKGGGGYTHDLSLNIFEDLGLWLPRLIRFSTHVKLGFSGDALKRDLRRLFGGKGKYLATFPVDYEPKLQRKLVEERRQALIGLMPLFKDMKLTKIWTGLIDITPDLLPVLGKAERPDGFTLAAGFCGRGWALGPVTGKLIAELILEGKTSLPIDAFSLSRLARGKKVPIPPRYG